MLRYNLPQTPQVSVKIKPSVWMNNCSRRKAREQENSKKKLSAYINTQFVLVSSSQWLKKKTTTHKFK